MSEKIIIHYEEKPIYSILIEHDFQKLGQELRSLNYQNRRFCIVSDSNVAGHYSDQISEILKGFASKVCCFTIPAGEESKNLSTVEELYKFLINEKFDRKDVLVALGGGVVGDLTGYTAATYLRGIDFIQIPTSLLAQVDSSIGGKTGVDFDSYKNMIGAFYQPKLVYMNLATLDTLDLRQYYSGLAEVIKYGLIKDLDFYVWMIQNIAEIYTHEPDVLEQLVTRSCLAKRDIVEKDPKEQGERALLNFGHTIGHSIEKRENFRLLHGECVALGMLAAAHISWQRNYIEQDEFLEFRDMLVGFRLPISLDEVNTEELIAITKLDKKMDAGKIKFILLKEIGTAYIDTTVTDKELKEAIQYLKIELED